MSVSSLYDYYPSKEALANAVPVANFGEFFAEYAELLRPDLTPEEGLRQYLWLHADFSARNPDWSRLLYLEVWPSVLISGSQLRAALDDFVRVHVRLIMDGARRRFWEANNPYQTASIMTGAMNHVIITWSLYRQPHDLQASAGPMVDELMRLLPRLDNAAPRSTALTGASRRPKQSGARRRT